MSQSKGDQWAQTRKGASRSEQKTNANASKGPDQATNNMKSTADMYFLDTSQHQLSEIYSRVKGYGYLYRFDLEKKRNQSIIDMTVARNATKFANDLRLDKQDIVKFPVYNKRAAGVSPIRTP